MLNDFDIFEIEELQHALDHLFDQKTFPLVISSPKIQKILDKKEWINSSDLLGDLKKITDSKTIAETQEKLSVRRTELESRRPESTVPQNREELEKERAQREQQQKESKAAGKIKTQLFIKSQEKLYLSLPKKLNPPEFAPEDEAKLNDLIKNKIAPNPTFYADGLAKEIIKQNRTPEMSRDELGTLQANAKIVAMVHTDKMLGLVSEDETLENSLRMAWAQNPIHIAASLVNPDNPTIGEETAKSAQITALTLEHDNLIARRLLSKAADPKILPFLYPGAEEIIVFEVSNKENKDSIISVDRKTFTEQGIKLEESNNGVFDLVRQNAWKSIKDNTWRALDRTLGNTPWYSRLKSLVPNFLKPHIPIFAAGEAVQPGLSLMWGNQGIRLMVTDLPTLLSSSFGKGILLTPSFNFQFGSFAISRTIFTTAEGITGQTLGINIGNFGITFIKSGGEKGLQLLINLGTKAAVPVITGGGEAVAGAAAKTGLSSLISGWLASVGVTVSVPVLNIIVFIGGLLLMLIQPILNWAKKHQDTLKVIGGIILTAGALFQSLPLMVFGGLIFVPLVVRNGLSVAGLTAGSFLFFRRLGKVIAIRIATPVIVAIICFPILVAIILFIINSGAYLVPPQPTIGSPFGPKITCTTAKDPVSFPNNTASAIAHRAWEITADLYQGFWCFWNRPPAKPPKPDFPNDILLYPPPYNMFSYDTFEKNPNPTESQVQSCSGVEACLFWCTALIQKSYRENGNRGLLNTLGAAEMEDDFKQRDKFVPAIAAAYKVGPLDILHKEVVPGSVIFFHVVGGHAGANHVGIVYSVTKDRVIYVQANAGVKDSFVPFGGDGFGLESVPGIDTEGIGLP